MPPNTSVAIMNRTRVALRRRTISVPRPSNVGFFIMLNSMSDPNILPKVTSDEVDPSDESDNKKAREKELLENRPPHYED